MCRRPSPPPAVPPAVRPRRTPPRGRQNLGRFRHPAHAQRARCKAAFTRPHEDRPRAQRRGMACVTGFAHMCDSIAGASTHGTPRSEKRSPTPQPSFDVLRTGSPCEGRAASPSPRLRDCLRRTQRERSAGEREDRHRQQRGSQQIIRQPQRQPGQRVRAQRRDHHQISGCGHRHVRDGIAARRRPHVHARRRPLSAAKVSGAMNCVAASVMITSTCAPACTSLLHRSAALYAAMPPVTPNSTCLPVNKRSGMIRSFGFGCAWSVRLRVPYSVFRGASLRDPPYCPSSTLILRFADSPFADSPFADSPFADSPFADSPFADSPFADSPFADSFLIRHPLIRHPLIRSFADSPFADSPFADSSFADSLTRHSPIRFSPRRKTTNPAARVSARRPSAPPTRPGPTTARAQTLMFLGQATIVGEAEPAKRIQATLAAKASAASRLIAVARVDACHGPARPGHPRQCGDPRGRVRQQEQQVGRQRRVEHTVSERQPERVRRRPRQLPRPAGSTPAPASASLASRRTPQPFTRPRQRQARQQPRPRASIKHARTGRKREESDEAAQHLPPPARLGLCEIRHVRRTGPFNLLGHSQLPPSTFQPHLLQPPTSNLQPISNLQPPTSNLHLQPIVAASAVPRNWRGSP